MNRNEPKELMEVGQEMGEFGDPCEGDLVKAWRTLTSQYNLLLAEGPVL